MAISGASFDDSREHAEVVRRELERVPYLRDVLVRLWIPELIDEEEQRKALVEQAESRLAKAEVQVQVMDAMLESNQSRVPQAQARVGRTEGESARWEAEYERLRELAERGSITPKLVDVPESEALFADPGDPAMVRIQALGQTEFPGRVVRTSWGLDESNRSIRLEVEVTEGLTPIGKVTMTSLLVIEDKDVKEAQRERYAVELESLVAETTADESPSWLG